MDKQTEGGNDSLPRDGERGCASEGDDDAVIVREIFDIRS